MCPDNQHPFRLKHPKLSANFDWYNGLISMMGLQFPRETSLKLGYL